MTYQIRHETFNSAITAIELFITNKGYNLPNEFSDINFWGNVSYNQTFDRNIALQNNDGIAFQVYRSSNGTYELNMYFWK